MSSQKNLVVRAQHLLLLGVTLLCFRLSADTNVNVRVMSANLNGNTQSYQPFALRIFEGLKPDIVAIQEFNYGGNTAADFRSMLDTAFGTDFTYYREGYTASGDIPNGIISRYPIVASGSWTDTVQSSPNRGFAWAQIQLPGTNYLYVVSVHLLTSSAANRAAEASVLMPLIRANFPTNGFIVLAGDFNTDSRTEACMTTFETLLSDNPIPVDNNGNSYTSENRNHPHDYVLPSFAFTNFETPSLFPSHTFPSGLVFDSTVYTPLSDVSPVLYGDSTNAQHMAVIKDFTISASGSGATPPVITTQPQSQTADVGTSVSFNVVAYSTNAMTYQWRLNNLTISGATNDTLAINNVQSTNAGSYTVVVANSGGNVTSSNAVLTVNTAPVITSQPSSNTVYASQSATFSVTATGASPLSYQWVFNGTNIANANTNAYTVTNAQTSNQGNYAVVITNYLGSVTSINAGLLITTQAVAVIVEWDFNSPTPDANTGTGTLTPVIGTGTASYVGGTSANGTGFASGSTTDPNTTDNSGWNMITFPASSSANKTAGAQFTVSTAGRQNIVIRWDQRGSSSASKYSRLQYSTNGTTWTDYPTAITLGSTSFEPETNNLSAIPTANDSSNFTFRIVAEFQSTATGGGSANYVGASGTYATSGSMRFDMVTVSGSVIPVIVAPSITNQPASQSVAEGGSATFTVGAGGTSPSYQWQLWSTNIPGATASTYTRSNVQPEDEGFYSVIVSNSAGSVTSSNAYLSVIVPPSIIDQPVDQIAVVGSSASFSVDTAGSGPLSFQWQLASTNLLNETNSVLNLNNIASTQAGVYTVSVTNAAGFTISSNAVLTVYATAVPTLTSSQWANGQFQLNVSGVPGYSYIILGSTNLTDWNYLQTNTSPFIFSDPDSSSLPLRFYRAVYAP